MSMTFTIFTCTGCGFSGASHVLWGSYSYEHGDQLIQVDRALGWCEGSAGLAPVEVLPNPATLEEMRIRLGKMVKSATQAKDELIADRSWLTKFLNLSLKPTPKIRNLEYRCQDMEKKIHEYQKLMEILSERQSPPRCLICGSTHIAMLPKNHSPKDGAQAVAIGFKHPYCGGDLLAKPSEISIARYMDECVYDVEGNLLSSEEMSPYGD